MKMMRKILAAALVLAMVMTGMIGAMAEGLPTIRLVQDKQKTVLCEGITWDFALNDAAAMLYQYGAEINYEFLSGWPIATVTAKQVPIGDYTADEVTLIYHDDVLCQVTYVLKEDCSRPIFENMDASFRIHYGDPITYDPANYTLGNCADMWDSLVNAVPEEERAWWENALVNTATTLLWPFGNEEVGYREWDVDEETRLNITHWESNSFLAKDYLEVRFTNLHPHTYYGPVAAEETAVETTVTTGEEVEQTVQDLPVVVVEPRTSTGTNAPKTN